MVIFALDKVGGGEARYVLMKCNLMGKSELSQNNSIVRFLVLVAGRARRPSQDHMRLDTLLNQQRPSFILGGRRKICLHESESDILTRDRIANS